MLDHLENARQVKNISLVSMSAVLGVKYQTFRVKINGTIEFIFKDALKIQEEFFPEYEIKFLFKK
ncbi:XRE family transcriptional regulator [Enterococcus faecalis]|uniref:XRE family transcriptional regulator n=1 Tax=Enterococcus faecalis TaxID=1351 RepID=UPI0030C8A003